MDRQVVRETAGRMFRSDDLTGNEREAAAEFLRGNPAIGNPHMVRCAWCRETDMLFLDEEKGSFTRAQRGWRCTKCDEFAASQEVKF